MKLLLLPVLFALLRSALAAPASISTPDLSSPPTSPNKPRFEFTPSFDRDACCTCFRQLWGTYFGGPRACDGACVCDWCGTNVKNASYGTPCVGANKETDDWSWCTNHCVPSYSVTLSLPLPPWTGTSWPADSPTATATPTPIPTPSSATVKTTKSDDSTGSGTLLPTKISSMIVATKAELERKQVLSTGTEAVGSSFPTTLVFSDAGPGATGLPISIPEVSVTVPGVVTLTVRGG